MLAGCDARSAFQAGNLKHLEEVGSVFQALDLAPDLSAADCVGKGRFTSRRADESTRKSCLLGHWSTILTLVGNDLAGTATFSSNGIAARNLPQAVPNHHRVAIGIRGSRASLPTLPTWWHSR